jgi:hypothetical protein
MNVDSQKFFIGLMDFFSIVLPGAVLNYLLMCDVGPGVLGVRYAKLAGAQAWAAFLLAASPRAHILFLLPSARLRLCRWAAKYQCPGRGFKGGRLSW